MSPFSSAECALSPERTGSAHSRQLNTARPAPYLRVPDRLLRAYAHDPLAVGVYLAVARCALVCQGPVPLSTADLAAWAGVSRARDVSIMRRVKRLLEDGWLSAEADVGVKRRLCPTWGRDAGGSVRPWDWCQPQLGKPEALRARRVPTELLDTYLGRLDPQPGRRPAAITRYFDRPLLDLADIGAYALCMLVATEPTVRLRRLGLFAGGGPVAPYTPAELLQKAARGALFVSEHERILLVLPSPAGWRKLGYDVQPHPMHEPSGSASGSGSGSDSGLQRISGAPRSEDAAAAPECENTALAAGVPEHTWESWESRRESINNPPPEPGGSGGGDCAELPSAESNATLPPLAPDLDPAIQQGHQALNPQRHIAPGEWLELAQLQSAYGREQLLVWQARAARAQRDPARGVSPGYYVACAATAECANQLPLPPPPKRSGFVPAALSAAPSSIDPLSNALLDSMGVRNRRNLAGVPAELVAAWHAAVQHPGMAARFADPVAFAVSQLVTHTAPPSLAQLERWAAWQQTTRNAPPQLITAGEPRPAAEDEAWSQHAHALLPGASQDELAHLVSFLAQGADDAEALALLEAQRAYEAASLGQEVGL